MNKVVLLLLVSTVGLGLVSLHLVRELRKERAHSSALQTELDSSTGVSPAFKDERDTRAEAAPMVAPGVPPPSQPAMQPKSRIGAAVAGVQVPMVAFAGGTSEEAATMFREQRERQRTLMQDPAYRAAMIEQQKTGVRMMQRGLQRELGLSDEQYERLLDLQAEQMLRSSELTDPFAFSNAPMDATALQERSRQYTEMQERNEKELRARLGEEKYREYRDFQETIGARSEVTQLNLSLAEAGIPLREDQRKPLIRAIHESNMQASQNYMSWQQGSMGQLDARTTNVHELQQKQLEFMREQNKRVRQAAARVLSDEQVEVLARQQEERIEMQETQLRMMQAQADAIARGEVPPVTSELGISVAEGHFVPAPQP